jgi:Secretion system C-terminal sorting domain
MKQIYVFFFVLLTHLANSQNLTQADFAGVIVPKYIGSGTSTRLPYAYRATVSNLTPNATYRYINQAGTVTSTLTPTPLVTDIGTANAGAGNPMFIDPATAAFTYTTTTGFVTAGQYGQFTTDASGSFTGWFCFVNTGNTRFTAGSVLAPSITLNDGAGGTVVAKRLALDQTVTVLTFATTAGANDATFIRGTSNGAAKDIVALYDNTGATGRPLSMTYIESEGVIVASAVPLYTAVDAVAGSWGTIIPNANPNGVKAIQRFALSDGTIKATNTDADGVWPSTANTVNPTGGSATPIVITTTDATLPIDLKDFTVVVKNNTSFLAWQTASEKDNAAFNIERSNDGQNFVKIGQIKAVGNSQTLQNYQFSDETPWAGLNYYRLQQVDIDGKTMNSAVKSVAFGRQNGKWTLVNSLVKDEVLLSNAQYTEGSLEVAIFDMTGRQVQQSRQSGTQIKLNVAHLTSGLYFIRMGSETVRFFK